MNNNKINISFVLPSLSAGGAERIVSFIAQELDKNLFNATLVIISKKTDSVYKISGIDIIYLEKKRVLRSILGLFKFIKTNKPDIVMSSVGHLNSVLAYLSIFFPKTKFVAREVNVLSVQNTFNKKGFINMSFLAKNRFNFFDRIVCQSKDMYEDLIKNYKVKKDRLTIINNPVTRDFKVKSDLRNNEIVQFVTVASLKKQKGHERILKVLKKLDFPFHYTIIGDGAQKSNIYALINELDLTNYVTHVPFTKQVNEYLGKSDIFLQGSYVEGFPNSLIESCAVGTPVVAFNAPGGLDEIIINGINGYISENENEFIENIKKLVFKQSISPKDVSHSVFSKFSPEIIIKQYEDLFISLLKI